MDPGSRRHKAPLWPPSRQGKYHNLSSQDDLHLQDTPSLSTPGTGMSGAAAYSSLLTPKLSPSPYNTPGLDSSQNTPYLDAGDDNLKYELDRPASTWFGYGWRGGAKLAFSSTVAVFLVNVTIIVYLTTGGFQIMDGFPVIYRGSCENVNLYNRLWHLLINVLSTGLLAASNYCMQLLSAPTRVNLDAAHARGHWLDIGIQSIRNLRFLGWKRRGLWFLLCVSSVPLHLVYNSTFYGAIAANEYNILYATAGFAEGASYDKTRFPDTPDQRISVYQSSARNTTLWQTLNNRECIDAYGHDFVTNYRNVIAVVSDNTTAPYGSLLAVGVDEHPNSESSYVGYNPFGWICDDPDLPSQTGIEVRNGDTLECSAQVDALRKIASARWKSRGYRISHCLAERVPKGECHLHFSPHLMAPVIVMNIIKCLVAFYVAFRLTEAPIITLGDAITTFVKHPDPTTVGMCLLTAREAEKIFNKKAGRIAASEPRRFVSKRERWLKVVSIRQWSMLLSLLAVMILGLILGLIFGVKNLRPATLSNAWSIGLGQVRTQNLVMGARVPQLYANAILITALIANAPQLAVSFLYLLYNTAFTLMQIGEDWDLFGAYTATTRHKLKVFSKRETHRLLRVSDPRGQQKSTYMLNLPLRFAIPLLTISALMHFLMAMTFFLANVSIIPRDESIPRHDEITTVAYAPLGMMWLLVLAIFMILILVGHGLRRFGGEMQIVGSNSAAISAACQVGYMPERRRREMVLRKVGWGELPSSGIGERVSTGELSTQMQSGRGLGIGDSTDKFKHGPKFTTTDFDDQMGPDDESEVTDYQMHRGEVEMVDIDGHDVGRSTGVSVGHCGFSDGFVFKPEAGKMYT